MPFPNEQFRRSVEIDVVSPLGAVRVESRAGAAALRVAFSVERDTKPFPNAASFGIWNLAKTTRKRLLAPAVSVRISAGYGNAMPQQIFLGSMRRVTESREGPDIVFRAEAGDGEKEAAGGAGAGPATINVTFAKGTPVVAVINAMIAAIKILPGNVAEVSSATLAFGNTLNRPLTLAGPVTEELAHFCRSLGLTWSIQDGAFQFLRADRPITLRQGPLVSSMTGLIGSPTTDVDKDGKQIVTGRALLMPEMLPGRGFMLNSEAVTGYFACTKTKHSGDTHGNDWFVDFEARAL